MLQQIGPIFWRQRHYLRLEGRLRSFVEFWRSRRASGNCNSYLREELLLSRGRTNAQHADRLTARVMKLVRCVRRDVDGFACLHAQLSSSKCGFDLALQDNERLLKIMPVGRRTAAQRNMHIDKAESPGRIFPREQYRVRVSHQSDVRQILIVRSRNRQSPAQNVRRKKGTWLRFAIATAAHHASLRPMIGFASLEPLPSWLTQIATSARGIRSESIAGTYQSSSRRQNSRVTRGQELRERSPRESPAGRKSREALSFSSSALGIESSEWPQSKQTTMSWQI
jgi:hypothetical protein